MHATRFELARISPVELKSTALTNSATRAYYINKTISLNLLKNTLKCFNSKINKLLIHVKYF